MTRLKPEDRITIEEVLADKYFEEDMATELDEKHQKLRTVCDDVVTRHNVWTLEGRDKLDEVFNKLNGELIDEEGSTYWAEKIEHARKCARNLVFEEDPDATLLNEIKERIGRESKEAYAKRKAKEEAGEASDSASSDGSQESAEEKKEGEAAEIKDNKDATHNEFGIEYQEEGDISQMGCFFDPK